MLLLTCCPFKEDAPAPTGDATPLDDFSDLKKKKKKKDIPMDLVSQLRY
jgi:hypothetical protein